jgi:hypothetical protein
VELTAGLDVDWPGDGGQSGQSGRRRGGPNVVGGGAVGSGRRGRVGKKGASPLVEARPRRRSHPPIRPPAAALHLCPGKQLGRPPPEGPLVRHLRPLTARSNPPCGGQTAFDRPVTPSLAAVRRCFFYRRGAGAPRGRSGEGPGGRPYPCRGCSAPPGICLQTEKVAAVGGTLAVCNCPQNVNWPTRAHRGCAWCSTHVVFKACGHKRGKACLGLLGG